MVSIAFYAWRMACDDLKQKGKIKTLIPTKGTEDYNKCLARKKELVVKFKKIWKKVCESTNAEDPKPRTEEYKQCVKAFKKKISKLK